VNWPVGVVLPHALKEETIAHSPESASLFLKLSRMASWQQLSRMAAWLSAMYPCRNPMPYTKGFLNRVWEELG